MGFGKVGSWLSFLEGETWPRKKYLSFIDSFVFNSLILRWFISFFLGRPSSIGVDNWGNCTADTSLEGAWLMGNKKSVYFLLWFLVFLFLMCVHEGLGIGFCFF